MSSRMAKLSPIHTGDYNLVAENGDCRQKRRLSPNSATAAKTATVAENGDCRRIRRQIVAAKFGDYSRQCGQGFTG